MFFEQNVFQTNFISNRMFFEQTVYEQTVFRTKCFSNKMFFEQNVFGLSRANPTEGGWRRNCGKPRTVGGGQRFWFSTFFKQERFRTWVTPARKRILRFSFGNLVLEKSRFSAWLRIEPDEEKRVSLRLMFFPGLALGHVVT